MQDNNQDVRPKDGKQGKKILLFAGLFVILLAAAYFTQDKNKADAGKINFDLYVMSQCPYGTQAEEAVAGAMAGFDDYVNFNVEYIADKTADGNFQSLHGQNEVSGDLYQLCVKSNYQNKFWEYLACQNKNYQDLNSSFEPCANEIGADFNKLKTCAEGQTGSELLTASSAKAKELNVSGSPTFYINGEQYTGARTKIALQRALCGAIENKAKVCQELPQDKEFTAYLMRDSRCTTDMCATSGLEEQLKITFPKIKVAEMDYITDNGKEFFEKYELTYLPAVLFTKDVEMTDNYSQVQKYLTPTADLYNLAIGASYNPTKEICYNNIDDTGNGKVDCADPDCEGFLECRSEKPKRLDLFVMSMCPYGTQAMNSTKEVLDNFGNNIDLHINYIANENADGSFQSLHGQSEVDENMRELCAMKYYPETYLDYIWCRNKNIQGDWTECAADYSAIKVCFEGSEGKKLHSENIAFANSLNIGASPTWLVNNRYAFNGIDAETAKTNFCKYNDVEGCQNTLTGQTQADSASTPAGSCN